MAGRDFTWTDVYDKRPVAIVSENLSRELFLSSAFAFGKRVREYYDKRVPWLEIVGVAFDGNIFSSNVSFEDSSHVLRAKLNYRF
jgi:hypothetical protein